MLLFSYRNSSFFEWISMKICRNFTKLQQNIARFIEIANFEWLGVGGREIIIDLAAFSGLRGRGSASEVGAVMSSLCSAPPPSPSERRSTWCRVERYGSRATVSFESLHIRIPLKFCQNSAKLSQFFRNSENFRTSQHFLECSAKFRKKIIKICAKFDENCRKIRIFAEIRAKMRKKFDEFLRRFWVWSGAKVCKSCRSRKMLKNEYLVAKIGFDTEENEPSKVW